MRSFKEYLDETVGAGGLAYELKVYEALTDAKIEGLDTGDKPGAGFSSHGFGDIEAAYNGKAFNIEIKAGIKDQMGGGSLRYDRKSRQLTPSPKLAASGDQEDIAILMQAVQTKIPALNKYLDFIAKQEPTKVHKDYAKVGVPFVASISAREAAKKAGLQSAVQDYVKGDSRYIKNLYNGKNVYYIQIGGAGLFYMGKNPLNLPVPEFNGEIQVEVRIGYAGDSSGSTSKAFTNKAGSKDIIEARRAELRCIGRMLTRSKSPYSLDNMNDVKKLFGAE
tara:strand:+ start:179 stop:1012 length:834 start_codon:yes stop_codon:yes gene_type:complete